MTLDTLKKTGLIVGIAAGISAIIVAVVAVVTLFMNVATKDDIADLKAEMQTGIQTLKAEMQTGLRVRETKWTPKPRQSRRMFGKVSFSRIAEIFHGRKKKLKINLTLKNRSDIIPLLVAHCPY